MTARYRCKRCLATVEFWQIEAHIQEKHAAWIVTFDWKETE